MANKRFLLVLGVLIGSFALYQLSQLVLSPTTVQAFADNSVGSGAATVVDVVEKNSSDSGCGITGNYPANIMQWCSQISSQASFHGLDPNLIAALVLQESGGNSDAYSKSGAVGLMQVMPRDGLAAEFMCPNGPCFANRPSMAELYDPSFDIEYGTRFLSGLVSRYGGDVREALKFYGPANVDYYYADIVMGIYNTY